MTTYPFRARRWTRKEYRKLDELGVLPEDEPIELIDGHLIVAEPKGAPHATFVRLTAGVLGRAFGDGWLVIQSRWPRPASASIAATRAVLTRARGGRITGSSIPWAGRAGGVRAPAPAGAPRPC